MRLPSVVIPFLRQQPGLYTNGLIATKTLIRFLWATGASYTATSGGNYAVEVKKDACVDTSVCTTISVGIESLAGDFNVTVFPNPTSGFIRIELGRNYPNLTLTIRNLVSQLILEKSYQNTKAISTSLGGASGIYLVEVKTNDGTKIVRVVMERD